MPMVKRAFGKTGLAVSQLGFGCMRLPIIGDDKSNIDVPLATAMIRKAIDSGVNYVDTAWPYHGNDFPKAGESEPFVAKALRDGYREKVALATKMPVWIVDSQADMHRLLDEQLKRLETSCLDVYLVHNLNTMVWPKMRDLGVLRFLDDATKDGRIKHGGFSYHDNFELFTEILDAYDWPVVQIQYNYLDTCYQAGAAGLDLLEKKGSGVVIMEPLRGGFLVNNIPDHLKKMLNEIRPGRSLAEWALRWVLDHPAVHTVLSGMSTMEQVDENLRVASTDAPFDDTDRKALEDVRSWITGNMPVQCTACGYCLPCPSGVSIPDVFTYFNEYHLDDTEETHARGKTMYTISIKEEGRADKCIGCQVCEERCPQGIPIAEKMKEVAATFGYTEAR